MAEFVVELYVSRAQDAQRAAERLRAAAEDLSRRGTPVRYLRRLFVPPDETCLLLVEADSAEIVRAAASRAAVEFERIAEAQSDSGDR